MADDPAQRRSAVAHHPEPLARFSLPVWLAAAAACGALCFQLAGKVKYSGEDSWLPMSRALDVLYGSSPSGVYQTLFFSGHVKFQYPPSGLLSIDLLRHIGIATSAQYNAINLGLLIVTGLVFAVFAVQTLGAFRCFGLRIPVGPIAFLVAVRFYPNLLAFQFGQMQILLGLCFLLASLALLHERRIMAGLLIAAAATVKPQFILLGVLALWQRDWRFVAGFGVLLAAALLLSIGLYGWDVQLEYLKVLGFLSQHGEYHHLNQSINGILNRFLYDGPSVDQDPENPIPNSGFPPYMPAVYFPSLVSSLIMIAIPFTFRMKANDRMATLLGFCTASLLFTMASPIAWVHHYNVALPAYVVALKAILSRGQDGWAWGAIIALGISFVLIAFAITPAFGPTIPSLNIVQSHVFIGAGILVCVLLGETVSYARGKAQPLLVGSDGLRSSI
jgi:Glycosyltransferase family 87